jgi:hypothetical protein
MVELPYKEFTERKCSFSRRQLLASDKVEDSASERDQQEEISRMDDFITGGREEFLNWIAPLDKRFGDHFFENIGSPFFRAFYVSGKRGEEGPYGIAFRLYRALSKLDEIDPGTVLTSVLDCFVRCQDVYEGEKERLLKLVPLLPEFVDLLVPLWRLHERTGLDLYVPGLELFQVFSWCVDEAFPPLITSLVFLEKVVSSDKHSDREKSELIPFIPGALFQLVDAGYEVDRSIDIISAISEADYGFASRLFGRFDSFLELNPWALALKTLASHGILSDVARFFSVLDKKMRRIPIGQKEFFDFASSIFEGLMDLSGNICLPPFLSLAKELIESSVIPEENDPVLDQPVESCEQGSLNDTFDSLTDLMDKHGVTKVPLSAYKSIARQLLAAANNHDIIPGLAAFLSDGESLDYMEKKCFKKPIAYKFLYLHQVFSIGGPEFKLLMAGNRLEEAKRVVEESKGDPRYLTRVFPVQVHVESIYEMSWLSCKNIKDMVRRGFWLSFQGADASQFLNEEGEEEEEEEDEAESLSKDGDGSESSNVKGNLPVPRTMTMQDLEYNVPANPEIAMRYVEIFDADERSAGCLRLGIWALKYYMNERRYEESAKLLRTIVPLLCGHTYESELTQMFLDLIDCSSGLLYEENAVEDIIFRAIMGDMVDTEELGGDQPNEVLIGEREVDGTRDIANPARSSGLTLEEMIGLAGEMRSMFFSEKLSTFKEFYGTWNKYIETVIEQGLGMKGHYISVMRLANQSAEGEIFQEEVVPCIFISGNVIEPCRTGFWCESNVSDEDFTEVFRNISCYGFSCRTEEETVAHPERAACLHVLKLDREHFRGSNTVVITIYNVHEPCKDCLNFLNTKFYTRELGIEKRGQFCLREERDSSENFADFLCERFNCRFKIIVKSVNRADITVVPRKRHDIDESDVFQNVGDKPPLTHWVQMADETKDPRAPSGGSVAAEEAHAFEKLLEKSEGNFRRSVERLCLECGVEFSDAFGNDFCNKVGSPFFRLVYREGAENPYDFAVRLYKCLLARASEIDPAKVLRSVLESFLQSKDDKLMAQERFSRIALMIPEAVKVVIPLWALAQRTGFNLYLTGMEILQILTRFKSPKFPPSGISARFLEKIMDSERCCYKEKLELIPFIPAALSHLIEKGNSAVRSLDIIYALARKDYSFASRYFGPFEAFLKCLNPYALALKALASTGTVEGISKFFSILERRMKRISIGQGEFFAFASSLFEALMKMRGDMADCLFRAGSLIEFFVIPANESVLSVGCEYDRLFCEQFGYYERKSADELFNFLAESVAKNGGQEVPIYLYGAIASLLLDFGENEEMLLQIRTSFPDFHILDFVDPLSEKRWLVKPVGYKLLYLHRIFAEGAPYFKRLLENQAEVLRRAEECGGDIRHMRPYIGKVHVDRLFTMPVLNAEKIVNLCPRAFKICLQGADGAEIFSEENKQDSEDDLDLVLPVYRKLVQSQVSMV